MRSDTVRLFIELCTHKIILHASSNTWDSANFINEPLFNAPDIYCGPQQQLFFITRDGVSLNIIVFVSVSTCRLQHSHDGDDGTQDTADRSNRLDSCASECCGAAARSDSASAGRGGCRGCGRSR